MQNTAILQENNHRKQRQNSDDSVSSIIYSN